MQLKAFDKNEKQKNNNKITILIVVVFLFIVTIVLGKSFALYQKEENNQIVSGITEICTIEAGTVWNFSYVENASGNGYEQEFKVPCTGNYRLETWGAQGGSYNTDIHGGYGGYSKGEINLNKNVNLYINVGGHGTLGVMNISRIITTGGYNGGGDNSSYTYGWGGTGGGATHIALESGLLSDLETKTESIIIVSGGGGGGGAESGSDRAMLSGNGGGISGTSGSLRNYNGVISSPGTQNSGFSFGKGQSTTSWRGAGGGGYYGGYGTDTGAGGSGFINYDGLKNKYMYCYECSESNEDGTRTISTTNVSDSPIPNYAKEGHGHARITYLGYSDPKLNGADPVLKDGLIPVKIESNGTVRKANPQAGWYDYENKEWANAIILVDKTKTYSIGEQIPESNIESYFVWIPKYSYQLWELGTNNEIINERSTTNNEKEIQIRFGITNTSDANTGECTTPMESGASGNCVVGDFMTHPAFISMNTTGLWVGKFEVTGSTSNISIKPNIASLRNISVKSMFEIAYNYKRTLDSHMMKNTEWGAVAYLSHSKYGINSEVRINNNSSYLTGYSSVTIPTCNSNSSVECNKFGTTSDITQPYNTSTGYKASTTGNITGIYDLSGGADEYVAAYKSDDLGNSGFNATTIATYDSKYFDVYTNVINSESYNKRILGDATGEMGNIYVYNDGTGIRGHIWYEDSAVFVDHYPWFRRGGLYKDGVLSGQFFFHRTDGSGNATLGYHLILAP